MVRRIWSRLRQFSLRALFLAISGCSVVLAIWATPFEADVKDPDEFRLDCEFGMSAKEIHDFYDEMDALRETGRVYRDFRGHRIKHGLAVLYDGKGVKLRERQWSHGKLDGLETEWATDGQIKRETRYREGKRHGWQRSYGNLSYFEDDNRIREESWVPYGKYVDEYHADGSETFTKWSHSAEKLSEVTYDARYVRQGPTINYHANGIISCEGNWRDGREHGTWNWWDDRGNRLRTIEFADGVQQSRSGTSLRLKYVADSKYRGTADGEFNDLLFGEFYLFNVGEPLSETFAGLEEYLNDLLSAPSPPRLRIRVRDSATRKLLDNAKLPPVAEKTILRDALELVLAPLHLEAVIHDNSIWIVDIDEARDWVEAVPVSRFVYDGIGSHIRWNDGLKLGRTTLRDMIVGLKDKNIALRLDENRVADAVELLAREVDADIPGCTLGTAIDIVLNQLGLTYYAHNDQFVVVPLESP